MEQKQQFVSLAGSGHFTVTELCEQFGISRKTGHKWLSRHAVGDMKALEERSRAPKSVTCRTSEEIEGLIVDFQRAGVKFIRRALQQGLDDRCIPAFLPLSTLPPPPKS